MGQTRFSCREMSALISRGQDQDIGPGMRVMVRIHLLFCRACNRLQQQFDRIDRITEEYLKHSPEDTDGPPLPEAARKRIRIMLEGNH